MWLFSDLPHKTSNPKHPDFPCCALGHVSPCEEVWLGREAGQSPEASPVMFGAAFSCQGLLWPAALHCCGNSQSSSDPCLVQARAILMGLHGTVPSEDLSWSFLSSKWVTVLSCVKVMEDFSINSRFLSACYWPFKFDAFQYVLLSFFFFFFSLQECSMTLCTISGCSGVNNFPLWFPALSFCFAVTFLFAVFCVLQSSCITVALMSLCVNERPCCPRSVVLGWGGEQLFIFFCCLHSIYFFFFLILTDITSAKMSSLSFAWWSHSFPTIHWELDQISQSLKRAMW